MKNSVQDGKTLRFTAGADISSGDPLQIGVFNGVAINDVANTEEGVLSLEGVYTLTKLETEAIDQGDAVYLDGSNKITKTAGALKRFGIAFKSEVLAATTIQVKLMQF